MTQRAEEATPSLLAKYRQRRNLSQEKAAQGIGRSRSTWDSWEHKRRPIPATDLPKIARVLKLTREELVSLVDDGANEDGSTITVAHVAKIRAAMPMSLEETLLMIEQIHLHEEINRTSSDPDAASAK